MDDDFIRMDDNGWSLSMIRRIKAIKSQCWSYTWIHRENSIYLNDIYDLISVIAYGLSFFNGIILIFPNNIIYVRILSVLLSFGSGILVFYMKNKNLTEVAEKHKITSSKFSNIYNNIARQLSLEVGDRNPGQVYHEWITQVYDTLFGSSPDIDPPVMEEYIKKFARKRKVNPIEAAEFNINDDTDSDQDSSDSELTTSGSGYDDLLNEVVILDKKGNEVAKKEFPSMSKKQLMKSQGAPDLPPSGFIGSGPVQLSTNSPRFVIEKQYDGYAQLDLDQYDNYGKDGKDGNNGGKDGKGEKDDKNGKGGKNENNKSDMSLEGGGQSRPPSPIQIISQPASPRQSILRMASTPRFSQFRPSATTLIAPPSRPLNKPPIESNPSPNDQVPQLAQSPRTSKISFSPQSKQPDFLLGSTSSDQEDRQHHILLRHQSSGKLQEFDIPSGFQAITEAGDPLGSRKFIRSDDSPQRRDDSPRQDQKQKKFMNYELQRMDMGMSDLMATPRCSIPEYELQLGSPLKRGSKKKLRKSTH